MSTDLYIYSYPKTSVTQSVQDRWNAGTPVDHVEDVFGEVKDDVNELEWSMSLFSCQGAFDTIKPVSDKPYHGDTEFPLTKSMLVKFANNLYELDYKQCPAREWLMKAVDDLIKLSDKFDFENNYLTAHTD